MTKSRRGEEDEGKEKTRPRSEDGKDQAGEGRSVLKNANLEPLREIVVAETCRMDGEAVVRASRAHRAVI